MTVSKLRDSFKNPGPMAKTMPKWVWNLPLGGITREKIREEFKGFKEQDNNGGVMIVLWGHDGYFSDEYIERYRWALEEARAIGLKIILWDENSFPSGFAGGLLAEKYPEYLAKKLDMLSEKITGPFDYTPVRKDGIFMGAVIMDPESMEITDISSNYTGDVCRKIPVEAGKTLDIMEFYLSTASKKNFFSHDRQLVDYLDREAVGKFIELTQGQYYEYFSEFFGDTIVMSFYDEPSMYHVEGARMWTPKFNDKFTSKYGFSPVPLYPAMFMDIGEKTAYARNLLFGFRADLWAKEYVKTLADWCEAHGIVLTGHTDQEEIPCPVPLCGDMMKAFSHQPVPGVDEIFKYQRGEKAYKIISSAAANYGKQKVMCEVFGAMGEDMPVEVLFKEGMDLYTQGVNFTVPHGTWFDNNPRAVTFPPELSYRSKKYGSWMEKYNSFTARMSAVLQKGKLEVHIGVLYPIQDLQAAYRFGPEDQYLGGYYPEYTNYQDIGHALSHDLRRDYIYIHPEVLAGGCRISGGQLKLVNEACQSGIQALILPAMRHISEETLRLVKAFYESGGVVISAGIVPQYSIDTWDREIVEQLAGELFAPCPDTEVFSKKESKGRAYYIPAFTPEALKAVLLDAGITPDLEFSGAKAPINGNLTYIHKVTEEENIYFVANSGDNEQVLRIKVPGVYTSVSLWDPMDGSEQSGQYTCQKQGGDDFTVIGLTLSPVKAMFVILS